MFSCSCVGSIYNPSTIVTSAVCCDGESASNVRVVAGEHDLDVDEGTEQVAYANTLILHEEYTGFEIENDICLIGVKPALVFNE